MAPRRHPADPCEGMRHASSQAYAEKTLGSRQRANPSLSKAGTSIDFHIYADDEKIGTMIIGRGSLTWFGRNRKTPIELNWTRFAQIMDERYDD